jgi:transcriptional regulator with XRE-family HTH domain
MGLFAMDIKKLRKQKLQAVIQRLGGAAEIERKYDVSASYLSQLLNGFRDIGEKSARNIEQKLNLAPMFLDTSDDEQLSYNLTPEMVAHLKVMQQLPEYARTEVIRDAIKTAELINKATTIAKNNGTEQ